MECESQTENQCDRIKLFLMLCLNKFCDIRSFVFSPVVFQILAPRKWISEA